MGLSQNLRLRELKSPTVTQLKVPGALPTCWKGAQVLWLGVGVGAQAPRIRLHALFLLRVSPCRELAVSSAGWQGHPHLPEPGRGLQPHHALRPLQR